MKLLITLIISSTLVGCGEFDREVAKLTGNAAKTCVDGVMYLQFTSGASVAYDQEGKVRKCQS